jgi:hydroxyquinol 1,2-dioxygenase
VQHLHAFVREAELTEPDFRNICALIAQAGQRTTASHNEVVLAAGSLGVSALVCLLNNTGSAGEPTTANLMGPFWRKDSPVTPNGGSIVRSPTPGKPVFVKALVEDEQGQPVPDAEVDVWQASGEGYYENQDPAQADMNLRGTFRTDAKGCIEFRTAKPSGDPIPVDGPVGQLIRAQGRHNLRPAHIHFMIHKAGYKTQFHSSIPPTTRTWKPRAVRRDGGTDRALRSARPSERAGAGCGREGAVVFTAAPVRGDARGGGSSGCADYGEG